MVAYRLRIFFAGWLGWLEPANPANPSQFFNNFLHNEFSLNKIVLQVVDKSLFIIDALIYRSVASSSKPNQKDATVAVITECAVNMKGLKIFGIFGILGFFGRVRIFWAS